MTASATISAIDNLSRQTGISVDRMTAVHETALQLLDLDYNAIPYGTDVVVGKMAYRGVRAPEKKSCGHGFKEVGCARVWRSEGLLRISQRTSRPLNSYDIRCFRPERLLAVLPLSPDFELLREQYAFLAEVLHSDMMTDDELKQFMRYVRG